MILDHDTKNLVKDFNVNIILNRLPIHMILVSFKSGCFEAKFTQTQESQAKL
jgi:hypothetical protein